MLGQVPVLVALDVEGARLLVLTVLASGLSSPGEHEDTYRIHITCITIVSHVSRVYHTILREML
jgi:hypothetical protein